MKKVWIMFIGIMFFGLVVGASYPSPFTSDNTAIVYGNGNPTTTTAGLAGSEINTLTNTNVVTTQTETEDVVILDSEDVCEIMKGCWENKECYPYGYRINNTYCELGEAKMKYTNQPYEGRVFLNQFDAMEQCNNSFECKSNFCFNRECVDTIRTVDDGVVKIDKSDLEELKSIIGYAEESMEGDYDEEVSKNFFSSLIGLFKNIFGL